MQRKTGGCSLLLRLRCHFPTSMIAIPLSFFDLSVFFVVRRVAVNKRKMIAIALPFLTLYVLFAPR